MLQVVGEALEEGSAPLEITITTDEKEKTLTIQDTVRCCASLQGAAPIRSKE